MEHFRQRPASRSLTKRPRGYDDFEIWTGRLACEPADFVMSVGGEPGHSHPTSTERSRLNYFFYDKDHGRGGPHAAQWSDDLSNDEEFGIFDQADRLELSDAKGNLY